MFLFMNILILIFIAAMAYWWGVQGFFSAFLHLMCVIAAGALSFALWEPVTQGLLMRGTAAHYAWCLGLLLPFIVLLLAIRLTLDRLVRKNMFFSSASNYAGGGVCGALAAYLTAGITVLGLINLPWGISMGGYQPYTVSGNAVTENKPGSFWVSPEKGTAAFFTALSANALSSSSPMASFRPSPVVTAVVNRLRVDDEASIVALPQTVAAERYYVLSAGQAKEIGVSPETIDKLMESQPSGGQLIAVAVDFKGDPVGTFDNDQALRITPTQVQLWGTGGEDPNLPLLPVAVTKMHDEGKKMAFIGSPMDFVASITGNSQYLWFYAAPSAFEPKVLMVRNTRLYLQAEPSSDDRAFLASAMSVEPATVVDPGGSQVVDTSSGVSVLGPMKGKVTSQVAKKYELTDMLPTLFSANFAVGSLEKRDGAIVSCFGLTVRPPSGFPPTGETAVNKVSIPPHLQAVRVELEHGGAKSVLGAAIATANLQVAMLRDSNGTYYEPKGYAWYKADKSYEITFDMESRIRSAKDIPIGRVSDGDQFFLYYAVERGVTLEEFIASPQNSQDFIPPLQLPK
jgi:hypothetical protein